MKTELATNAALKTDFDAAVDAQNHNDLNGALEKFKPIAAKGGTFGAEAQKHIDDINRLQLAAQAKQKFDAAIQAQNAGHLDDALSQFNALTTIAEYKDQAQTHIQQIKDKQAAAVDQQKWDDAVKKQSSNDLAGAQVAFRALMLKPGQFQSQAADRFAQVTDAIAKANNKVTTTESHQTTEQVKQPVGGARSGVVTLIPSGDYDPWMGPVSKGMTVPDNSVEGGLKPIGSLTTPAIDAPPKSVVVFIINIGPDGSVTPGRKTLDDAGIGTQVMAAARAWKFNPPTVKGKQVQTTIQVRVTF